VAAGVAKSLGLMNAARRTLCHLRHRLQEDLERRADVQPCSQGCASGHRRIQSAFPRNCRAGELRLKTAGRFL